MATITVVSAYDPTEQVTLAIDNARLLIAIPPTGPTVPGEFKFISFANLLTQILAAVPGGGGSGDVTISADSEIVGTVPSVIAEVGGQTINVAGAFDASDQITSVPNTSRFNVALPAGGPQMPATIRYITYTDLLAQLQSDIMTGGGGGNITISHDTELAGTVGSTITDGGTPTPTPTHTRYIAISTDDTFDAAEFLAGDSSTNNDLVVPDWTGGRRWIGIAVPDSTGDVSTISTGGFNVSMAFMRVAGTITISGEDYKVWRTINSQADNAAGHTYTVVQL